MADRDLVRTGISGLDAILSGGIPRGNIILLEGAIGTGKTTLGVEFVYRGASEFGEPGIIVLFEVSPDRLVRDAARLGWDLPALERAGKLKIIFTTRQVFAQELQQADSLLLEEAAEIGARRIFVDGMAGVDRRHGTTRREPRDTFHILAEGLQRENLTAVLAVEATAFSDQRATGAAGGSRLPTRSSGCGWKKSPAPPSGRSRSSSRAATIFRWAGIRSGSSTAAASRCIAACRRRGREPRPGRGLRSDHAHHHGCPRPRPAGQRRLLPRQHDGGRRHLGRRQERHGPAVSGRGGAARASAA